MPANRRRSKMSIDRVGRSIHTAFMSGWPTVQVKVHAASCTLTSMSLRVAPTVARAAAIVSKSETAAEAAKACASHWSSARQALQIGRACPAKTSAAQNQVLLNSHACTWMACHDDGAMVPTIPKSMKPTLQSTRSTVHARIRGPSQCRPPPDHASLTCRRP